MRSTALLAAFLLAGCGKQDESPDMVTADLEATSATPRPPVPDVPTASPAASPAAVMPTMQALGTEPFWLIKVEPDKLTWSSPEDLSGTPFAAAGKAEGGGWRYAGTLKGEAAELVIAPGKCSDGMSDTVYPYSARFVWGAKRLSGCARKR